MKTKLSKKSECYINKLNFILLNEVTIIWQN